MFRRVVYVVALVLATIVRARAQEAVSSITQSRLFTTPSAPSSSAAPSVDDGVSTSDSNDDEDNSFGAQIILKNQERPRPITLFGDVSTFYTSNVDLVASRARSDVFVVADAGGVWRPILGRGLTAEISAAAAIFRYDRASELDFERFSIGTGLNWAVPHGRGIVAFARYDLAELIGTGGGELLQDHDFTIGAQKSFVFGRSHFLTTGISATAGISTPHSQQRDQGSVYAAYHLQLTQSVGADLLYRYAAQIYNSDSRVDHNQVISLTLGWNANRWLRLDATFSAAHNDSNRAAFEYDVANVGAALRLNAKF